MCSDTAGGGTSIFDPVLTEVLVRWFTATNDTILDPFAGGSVRGMVCAALNRYYVGIDIRNEQIDYNTTIVKEKALDSRVFYKTGDSCEFLKTLNYKFDSVITCPPYFGLEKYSELPDDLSNMSVPDFLVRYREITSQLYRLLHDNRFASVVVSNVRDKQGNLIDLVGKTVEIFESSGFSFYNELVLVNSIGSLPVRVDKQMTVSKKIGKRHQNVLIFLKGDAREASKRVDI